MYNNNCEVDISLNVTVLTKTRKQTKHFNYVIDVASFHAMWLIRTDIKKMV